MLFPNEIDMVMNDSKPSTFLGQFGLGCLFSHITYICNDHNNFTFGRVPN